MADDEIAMDFVVRLGATMVQAGMPVQEVQDGLLVVADELDLSDATALVLPTAILVQAGVGSDRRSRLAAFRRNWLRLDQIDALDRLAHEAALGSVTAEAGSREIEEILSRRPSMPTWIRIVGMGVLSIGFSLLLQPTPEGVVLAFGLGLVVGALRVVDAPRWQAVLPVIATFVVSLAVFEFASRYRVDNPIRMLIPPLVLFLPGAALTTGTTELAAGDTVSGSSRLVEGVVNLLLLAFGIVAAAEVASLPSSELVDQPVQQLGWATPLLGLIVITLGHHLHNCAPRRALGWILVVSTASFAGQALGATLVSPELSGFFGGLVMAPLAIGLSERPGGPPRLTLFLPAFWVLVPGAIGLINLTEAVTTATVGGADFAETAVTVASITLGTLIGAATWRSSTDVASYARRRLEGFSSSRADEPSD